MDILYQNNSQLRLMNEYAILKHEAIHTYGLISEKELMKKEIEILLFDIGKDRLRRYFKWLFGRNVYNRKRVFINEILKNISNEISELDPSFNVNYSVKNKTDEEIEKYYERLLQLVIIVINRSKGDKINKVKSIMKILKLTPENLEKLEIEYDRFIRQRGGGEFDLVDESEIVRLANKGVDISYNPASPLTKNKVRKQLQEQGIKDVKYPPLKKEEEIYAPFPLTPKEDRRKVIEYDFVKDKTLSKQKNKKQKNKKQSYKDEMMLKNIYQMDLEDLKNVMMLYGYPIYRDHVVYLGELFEKKRRRDEFIDILRNDIRIRVNLIEEEKGLWSGIIKEFLLMKRYVKNSDYLYDKMIFNEINIGIYSILNRLRERFNGLLELKKDNVFEIKYRDFLISVVKDSIYGDFYRAFDIENRYNFKVSIDKEFEDEIKGMMSALVGFDKYGNMYGRSNKKVKNKYYKINLLTILKTDADGLETLKYIKNDDFINFFDYLYDIREIYVNIWSNRVGLKRSNRKQKEIKVDEKWKKFDKNKLEKYFNKFVQDRIFYLMRGYIYTLVEIINRDKEDKKNKDEILKMIRTGEYMYKLQEKNNVRIEVRDYIEMILVRLKERTDMDKDFRDFLIDNILKFITSYKIILIGGDEMTYMELFNDDDLLIDDVRINSLAVYIRLLNDIELNKSQKDELVKIMKKNREILEDKLREGEIVKRNIINMGEFTKKEKEIIRYGSNALDIERMLIEYKQDVNRMIKTGKDKVERRKDISSMYKNILNKKDILKVGKNKRKEDVSELKKYKTKEGLYKYVKFVLKNIYEVEYDLMMKKGEKKVTEKEEKKINNYSFNKALKDVEKTSKMSSEILRKNIIEKKVEKDNKLNDLFKKPESMIVDNLSGLKYEEQKELQRFRDKTRQQINHKIMMKKYSDNILDIFKSKYKLINNKQFKEIKMMITMFLEHQESFFGYIHKEVRNFMINYRKSTDDLKYVVDRVNYDYILIVCLMIMIMKGVSLKKIDNIKLEEVENFINLKGFDKVHNVFVEVIKVDKYGGVLVKKEDDEYTMRKDDIVVSEYLRVRITGSHIYKGQVGKLVLINGDKGRVLIYEGFINQQIVNISLDNLKLIETEFSEKISSRDINIDLKMKDVKKDWGDSIFTYIFKTFNNLMLDIKSTSLGLGYFRIMYNKMVKQLNEYLIYVNEDIEKRKRLEYELKKIKQEFGFMIKNGKKLRKKISKDYKRKLLIKRAKNETLLRKYKYMDEHGSYLRKVDIDKFKKFDRDFVIKGKYLLLKKNDRDFNKIKKELGDLIKQKDIKVKEDEKIEVDKLSLAMDVIRYVQLFERDLQQFVTNEYVDIRLSTDPQIEIVREMIEKEEEEFDEDDYNDLLAMIEEEEFEQAED